jgi:hypothetical protein
MEIRYGTDRDVWTSTTKRCGQTGGVEAKLHATWTSTEMAVVGHLDAPADITSYETSPWYAYPLLKGSVGFTGGLDFVANRKFSDSQSLY